MTEKQIPRDSEVVSNFHHKRIDVPSSAPKQAEILILQFDTTDHNNIVTLPTIFHLSPTRKFASLANFF